MSIGYNMGMSDTMGQRRVRALLDQAPHRRGERFRAVGMVLVLVASAGNAGAKETHFEKVKFELLQLYVKCTTCHADDKGAGLTKYGQRLAGMGKETGVQERMRRMERRVSEELAQTEPGAENDRVDIDGDGALNWVEILCGSNPSDAASVPPKHDIQGPAPIPTGPTPAATVEPAEPAPAPAEPAPANPTPGEPAPAAQNSSPPPPPTGKERPQSPAPPAAFDRARVEAIVDCRLCHTSVEKRGGGDASTGEGAAKRGNRGDRAGAAKQKADDDDEAPHNAFGELIAKLDPPAPAARPGSSARAPAAKPEPVDFLTRFHKVANQDLDRDKARNWEEIATFHWPTDKADTPSAAELAALKERMLQARRGDIGFGKAHPR
ncbi:MAG: hypothetical protein IT449_00435 [Phycisphaerales bacterium]|nr:hypothetical protein [Phycisphaerales bacterium]